MSTQCLYDILKIPNSATDPEIKKAYRTAALASHPDKNPDREAEAAEHFKQVQHAYAVLSDPHERAWYDAHRDQILRSGSTFRTGEAHEKAEMADATRVDLFSCFSPSAYDGFGEGSHAFYGFYGGVFDRLWVEEVEMGGRDRTQAPVGLSFGGKDASWDTVRAFYGFWESFVSAKTFVFADKWNLAEAPNRDVRRLMEKDNKKERSKLKKEFNSTVRELVAFVKKRDPRVAQRRREEEKEKVKREEERAEKEREKIRLRKEGAAEVKWMREQVLEEDAEGLDEILRSIELDEEIDKRQRRRKGKKPVISREESTNEESSASDEDGADPAIETAGEEILDGASDSYDEAEAHISEFEELYCPACRKSFRTHAQMMDHERSKKHKAAASKLRKQLLKEDKMFECAESPANAGTETTVQGDASREATFERVDDIPEPPRSKSKKKKRQRMNRINTEVAFGEDLRKDSHGGSIEMAQNSGTNFDGSDGHLNSLQVEVDSKVNGEGEINVKAEEGQKVGLTKKQKRKLREQKKKEQADTTPKSTSYSCNVCKKPFPSRNKLMRHVETSGHALHVTQADNMSRRKR